MEHYSKDKVYIYENKKRKRNIITKKILPMVLSFSIGSACGEIVADNIVLEKESLYENKKIVKDKIYEFNYQLKEGNKIKEVNIEEKKSMLKQIVDNNKKIDDIFKGQIKDVIDSLDEISYTDYYKIAVRLYNLKVASNNDMLYRKGYYSVYDNEIGITEHDAITHETFHVMFRGDIIFSALTEGINEVITQEYNNCLEGPYVFETAIVRALTEIVGPDIILQVQYKEDAEILFNELKKYDSKGYVEKYKDYFKTTIPDEQIYEYNKLTLELKKFIYDELNINQEFTKFSEENKDVFNDLDESPLVTLSDYYLQLKAMEFSKKINKHFKYKYNKELDELILADKIIKGAQECFVNIMTSQQEKAINIIALLKETFENKYNIPLEEDEIMKYYTDVIKENSFMNIGNDISSNSYIKKVRKYYFFRDNIEVNDVADTVAYIFSPDETSFIEMDITRPIIYTRENVLNDRHEDMVKIKKRIDF